MSPEISIRVSEAGRRYEAVLRNSEALSACRESLRIHRTRILSEELRDFLDFFQFYIIVYKENSTEVEWAVVGVREEPHQVRTPTCRYKSGHPGGRTLPRNRFTLQIGMRMKGCRRVSSKELQPKVFTLGP